MIKWFLNLFRRSPCRGQHAWDNGTLIDIGRNKLWRCTRPGCRAIRTLY